MKDINGIDFQNAYMWLIESHEIYCQTNTTHTKGHAVVELNISF